MKHEKSEYRRRSQRVYNDGEGGETLQIKPAVGEIGGPGGLGGILGVEGHYIPARYTTVVCSDAVTDGHVGSAAQLEEPQRRPDGKGSRL